MPLSKKQRLFKFLEPVIFPIVRLYWFLFRPLTYGVKVIVTHNDEVLLVKNDYGFRQWTFPGGKIDKGETPEQAAVREVKEEVGVTIHKPDFVEQIVSREECKRDTIYIFSAKAESDTLMIDEFEIQQAEWFKLGHMPELSSLAERIRSIYAGRSRELGTRLEV